MIKRPSKQLYQQQTPIENIDLSSDSIQNKGGKLPRKPWSVLTFIRDWQNKRRKKKSPWRSNWPFHPMED